MSATVHILPSDEKVTAGPVRMKLVGAGAALAAVGMALSVFLGQSDWKRFFYAYVTAWTFIASIVIGCLFVVILHHLTRSRWSVVVRRLAELVTGAFPIVALAGLGFIIPLAMGYEDLYYWAHHDARDAVLNHHLHKKIGWLEPGLFAVRYGLYFVLYIAIAGYFRRKSRLQDESGDPQLSEDMRVAAGPAVIAYSLVTIFFGFDILMSLSPKWYSTIYSVNFWGGAMVGAYAFLSLLAIVLQKSGRLLRCVNAEHYHDLGKWVFAFTFFWAYTAFSQFMLIWYANLPEETVFYKYRMFTDWQPVTIALLVGFFIFPFVFLMSRWTKRILPVFALFCLWQLAFHWLDLYWNVMPNINWATAEHAGKAFVAGPLSGGLEPHIVGASAVDLTTWVGMIGVLIAGVGLSLKGNLVPVKDPRLGQCLAHENY